MIEKIQITDASVIRLINEKLPLATIDSRGLMSNKDRLMNFHWTNPIGLGKILHVCSIRVVSSAHLSAISGNGVTATRAPIPLIITINNHHTTGILTSKIGESELKTWAYTNDGTYINVYYLAAPFLGDGVRIIAYSGLDLIMKIVDTPEELIYI